MAWTSDGQTLAIGTFGGLITLRDRTGAEKVCAPVNTTPIHLKPAPLPPRFPVVCYRTPLERALARHRGSPLIWFAFACLPQQGTIQRDGPIWSVAFDPSREVRGPLCSDGPLKSSPQSLLSALTAFAPAPEFYAPGIPAGAA